MKVVLDNKVTGFTEQKLDIPAISSKSYVHRLMIAAALADRRCLIVTNIFSEDMKATMNCLNAMGADIVMENEGFLVREGVRESKRTVLFCNESGSTARFLLPLATVFADEATLSGKGKLPERPNAPLCNQMRLNGVEIDKDFLPLNTKGRLKAGVYTLPGNVSSQFITGLLLSLPLLDGDSRLIIEGKLESAGYIDVTLDVLSMFEIKIERTEEGFRIPGNQKYTLDDDKLIEVEDIHDSCLIAEGDWSNSAYILGMGALGGEVTVRGLNPKSVQPDSEAIKLFKEFGATVEIISDCGGGNTGTKSPMAKVKVSYDTLQGITKDVSQIPDLVPALAVIASFAKTDSVFTNVQRLRIKESDRVESIVSLLKSYGAECEVTKNGECESMRISGANIYSSENVRCEVSSFRDHRIVLAAVMAYRKLGGMMVIDGAEAVNKSYPDFFKNVVGICEELS